MEVEDQVQLAHRPKVVVQHLHKQVDRLQRGQLRVGRVDAGGECEARVPPGDQLVGAPVLDVGGGPGVPAGGGPEDVRLGGPLLGVGQGDVKLGEAGLGREKKREGEVEQGGGCPMGVVGCLFLVARAL